ncbi:unnamed protein product [Colias eurytheme]|nr:unnamed protein product [Colias eurytheme]
MDAATAVAGVLKLQNAFALLSTLAFTAYLFPRQGEVSDLDDFDFIIVGAGSAGCVLADRLSACGRRVLLLEAGGDPPFESVKPGLFNYLPRTPYDYNYTSENDNFAYQTHKIKALNLTSGRVLGGGSSVNYMMYVRGCPGDYQRWAQAAKDNTWNWKGVYPYFIKSENLQSHDLRHSPYAQYHGFKGPLKVTRETNQDIFRFINSFEEIGKPSVFDINGPFTQGYTPALFTIADEVRQSTAYAFIPRMKRRPNLVVRKNSFVTKIIIDDDNVAIGVEFETQDGKKLRALARREVIVSAGSFNSARLLMLSGVGPRDQLEPLGIPIKSELPVGYHLQDHVISVISIKTEESHAPPPDLNINKLPFPLFAGYVSLDDNERCPQYQAAVFDVPNDSPAPLQLCAFNFGFEDYICNNLFNASIGRNTLFTNLNVLHPRSTGRVKLRSKDPKDPPIVEPGTFSDERDLDDLARYVEDYTKVLNSTYMRSINAEFADLSFPTCSQYEYGSAEFWRCYVLATATTMYHYVGTCRLGEVVDARLRVRGVRHLRVADASVVPYLPSGNINAPVIMIAEKAADFINSDHRCLH